MWMWILIFVGLILVCVGGYMYMTSYKRGSGDPRDYIDKIQAEKISPDMNRFAARKEAKVAMARTATVAALNQEAAAVTEMHKRQAEVTQAEFDRKEALYRAEEARKKEMAEHDIYMQLAYEAQNLGIPVESLIRVKEAELMKQLDVKYDAALAQQKIKYALIAKHLLEHQNIASLQEQIDRLIIEVAEIEEGFLRGQPVPQIARQRMIAEREQTISTFQEDKLGRERRLIQAYQPRQDAGGSDKSINLR